MFLIVAYAGLVGLIVGSAVNAIVWRLYVGRQWTRGRSMCPECQHALAAKDLVPVVSWLLLGGRCRYCRQPISWQYPVVELATAAAFAVSVWRLAPGSVWGWLAAGVWLVILTLLVILAVYDARWMLLPDKIMLPAIGLGLVYAGLIAGQQGSVMAARGPLLAALLAGSAFYLLVWLSKGRAMGGGDIKLVFLMGLLLGLKGTLLALFVAFDSAAAVGLSLIMLKLKRRRDHIPFGPFLVAGTLLSFWWGRSILEWYLRLNGL